MKKFPILIFFVLALLVVAPVFAREHEPFGNRIDITVSGHQEYPANTPFHINHGWMEIPPGGPTGQIFFELEVDGVILKPTYIEYTTNVGDDGPYFDRTWFYNFPEGMTGEHTFEGHWIAPCFIALFYGYVGECPTPMADYDWVYREVVVSFTP